MSATSKLEQDAIDEAFQAQIQNAFANLASDLSAPTDLQDSQLTDTPRHLFADAVALARQTYRIACEVINDKEE